MVSEVGEGVDKFAVASGDFPLAELTMIFGDTLVTRYEGASGVPLNSHDAILFIDVIFLDIMGHGGSGGDRSGQSILDDRMRRNKE